MTRFLDIGFAKISTILAIVLSIIYILRVVNKKYFNGENSLLKFINMVLRKHHKLIGIILIITGLVHGIYSSEPVLSLNLGTICWVLSILLGASWMFRKSFKKKVWIYHHRVLTVIFLISLAAHIVQVKYISYNGNFKEQQGIDNNITEQYKEQNSSGSNNNLSKAKYKDGTYTGVGRGFKPGLKVEVTIKNSKITDIIIVDHNESLGYYEVPFEVVPKDIIKKQSIDVDTVSGATRSSNGIKEAVEEALKKAI